VLTAAHCVDGLVSGHRAIFDTEIDRGNTNFNNLPTYLNSGRKITPF
jgi:hypothetical protein